MGTGITVPFHQCSHALARDIEDRQAHRSAASQPVGDLCLPLERIGSDLQRDLVRQNWFLHGNQGVMDWFPIGVEATAWSTEGETLELDALRRSIPQMGTLSGMTELEGMGTLELDQDMKDEFGDPVAKVTMEVTEWDRRAPAMMGELAPKIGEALGAAGISEITPPESGLAHESTEGRFLNPMLGFAQV
jgi:hypothetical protein